MSSGDREILIRGSSKALPSSYLYHGPADWEDSDQHGQVSSLITVYIGCSLDSQVSNASSDGQENVGSDCTGTGSYQ